MKSYHKTMDEILRGASPANKQIIEKIRLLIKETVPSVEETVKRGSIAFVLVGKKFVRIRNYASHVDLGFFNGNKLASTLLRGRGREKTWRHVEVRSSEEADDPEIKRLLENSARLFSL
jgi:hypothetical protein